MKIINAGFDYKHPKDFKLLRPNGSGDYVLLILRSPAFFVFENKTYHTRGNSVIIYKLGTPQIYGAHETEFINDWIHFELSQDEVQYLQKLEIPFDTLMEFQSVNALSREIKNIFFEKFSNNKNALFSADLRLKLIFLKISDLLQAPTQQISAILGQLSNLRNSIFSYPQKEWSVDKIAKELHISKSYLQHKYKALFGTNIKNDIKKSRIEHSQYLLLSTNHTIGSISNMCGYQNDVHFMRVFKNEIGCTPTEYRNTFAKSK